MSKIIIDLSEIRSVMNDDFYPLLDNEDRYLILRGGAGSGKSVFCAQKIVYRILKDYGKGWHKFLILRKINRTCKDSIVEEINNVVDAWGVRDLVQYTNKRFVWSDGSIILPAGIDDPEKIKSISGITSVWKEEATEFAWDDFKQINLRLRGETPTYKQIIISFNPIGKSSWLYTTFFENEHPDTYCHHSTWANNRFLDDKYINDLKNERDEWYYTIYTLGEWGVLKNIIFTDWEILKADEFESRFPEKTVYGVDFGFDPDPNAMIEVGNKEDGYYLKEILYETRQLNSDLIRAIHRVCPNDAMFYCDCAEPAYIEEMKRNNIAAIPSDKAKVAGKGSIVNGIDFMKRKRMYIHEYSINLINELQEYHRDTDKDGNVLPQPVDRNNHAIDAARYALWTNWGRRREPGIRRL